MTITQFGRIEVDPNLVPTAAPVRRAADGDAPFARELSAATARRREPQPVERQADAPPPADEPAVAAPEQPPTGSRSSTPPPTPATSTPDNAAAAVVLSPPPQPNNGAGGADRRINTAQATASPASISPAARSSGAIVLDSAAPLTTAGANAAPAIETTATNAVPAARTAGTPPAATAPNGESHGSQATATASRATPGYRTLNPQTLQLAQNARDSIFKQIVFQIDADRSEMRVLLNPPELGHLDLRLIVDKSGALQLSIITERPEVAAMLDRNASELKLLLQSKGFGDVQTNVQAGDSGTQRHPEQHRRSASATRAAELAAADLAAALPTLRRAGFITADGIDFLA